MLERDRGRFDRAELFADIPAELRLDRPLELPDGLSETEVFDQLSALAARNAHADSEVCFIGAGMYDHYVPALVDAIISRSEFLTPYTPYQPEVSQGGLQVMFEFQTAISELTGLPVANASLYEGPSSVASAAYLALGARKGRKRLVVSRGLHPHARATLETYARGFDAKVVEVGLARRRHGCRRARELRRLRRSPPSSSEPELPRRGRGPGIAGGGRARRGCALRCLGRRDHPRGPAFAGRVRGGRRGRRGPAARQPARLRRPLVRLLRRDRGAPAPDARADRRRDHRRRRPARLRARAADPRAAHPPREGDPQHLHVAGAERARRDDLPRLARPPRDRRARRAAGPPHRLRARAPGRGRRGRAAARGAGRPRVRNPPRRSRRRGPRSRRRPGHRRGLPARPRLPRARGRAAGRDHRAPLEGRHRPPRGGARAARSRRFEQTRDERQEAVSA